MSFTFKEAIGEQEARTWNGMKARATTASNNVDLFYKIGASRGKDIVPAFVSALAENTDYAVRIAQWARDVRGGAGERKLFRDILAYLAKSAPLKVEALLSKVPVLGRWDDVWSIFGINEKLDKQIVNFVKEGLGNGDGLLAKWLPRQSLIVNGKDFTKALREALNLKPAEYRKLVVGLSNTVEQKMCAREFDSINFSHVPSLAHSRYKKAFFKRAPEVYKSYVEALTKGDKSVKINASAVYPYDVLKTAMDGSIPYGTEGDVIKAQWEALPNYLDEQSILPMLDTSASMTWTKVSGDLEPYHIGLSLALYTADKLKGAFKDVVLAFTSDAQVYNLKGDILQKMEQAKKMNVGGSTNLHAAFERVLEIAVKGNVAQADMPTTILILSDMQFNQCTRYDDSAMQMIERKYEAAGYKVPTIVFWNLNDAGNTPAKFDKKGVALVSGFSPSIMRSILSAKEVTPEAVMLEAIMSERYDWQ